MRWLAALGLLAVAGACVYWLLGRGGAPVVPFAKVTRGRLESTLTTNARIEPSEWAAIRAPMAGRLASLTIALGDSVVRGEVVGHMESDAARAAVVAAEAEMEQARAAVSSARRGAPPAARAELESALETARVEEANAARRLKNLEALTAAQAATRAERDQAADRLAVARATREGVEKRLAALGADGPSLASALARERNAEAALALARSNAARTAVTSPITGAVYSLPVKQGAVLENGATIAEAGNLETMRAIIQVDEPELGRVAVGMPVVFTWDAQPGRTWSGAVEKMPVQIITAGSRHVGEVLCRAGNPGRTLPAGANVNATILSKVVESALIAPRESLRREEGKTIVYVLAAGHLERRVIRTGVASITHVEVLDGLREGEMVALPTEVSLQDGLGVTPQTR
ncbi:MAG: efflux RND transporter periplasmic adaptor subunit [Bryobacterales bacterium]|nr:efflux RND transporter periplasmic adaptor subunit [Bryobacterales bacterium]